ncbi:putative Zn(II)2Cys6 transcription factor [Rhypophila decipiens]|uniref:Zn(II)2Cys6 transcription factor n=1 Tax=Rhypophila decipiens TaxID=261697 RepID=A0AAN6Y9S5_9PEZI|nr:putative Zn(II)2Cys6 transcription factor [Rhypophila decipiens]
MLRARQSCDACKNRKTRCVRPGTGPCQYCASTGATCSTSERQQRRPYYRVSEEEYQCCIKLLGHFIPNATLDLATMKAMIAEMEQGAEITDMSSTTAEPAIETEESEVLKEESGCMVVNARGGYTYVGADSSVRFANAVAQLATGFRAHHTSDSSIMVPLVRSRLPPDPPESVISRSSTSPTTTSPSDHADKLAAIYLPPRHVCQRYATIFFSEIQSIYWFYSPEQFYTLLDQTYAAPQGTAGAASPAWLCSLYAIFAMCAAKPDSDPSATDYSSPSSTTKSAPEYLALAKSLGYAVCDLDSVASTDSVRALALLSLALHSSCFTVNAYLVTGLAVRMAYTLGLHRNAPAPQQMGGMDSVSRARVYRLWWTLYLLDQEVAVQLGYPFAIVDHVAGVVQTPPTTLEMEAMLDPGPGTPHGYLSSVASLVKLNKKISLALYVAPAVSRRRVVPFSAVTGCLADLQGWLDKLPPHLAQGPWTAGTAPSHKRAVAVLHLRYWAAAIRVQRPFLLDTALRARPGGAAPLPEVKAARYAELSAGCLTAAQKAVAIVERMRNHGLLTSLVLFDVQCVQELVHVFLLGKGCYAGTKRGDEAEEGLAVCMEILRGMERVGWVERVLPELVAQVAAREKTGGDIEISRGEEQWDGQRNSNAVRGGIHQTHRPSLEELASSERNREPVVPWSGFGSGPFEPIGTQDASIDDALFDAFQDPE